MHLYSPFFLFLITDDEEDDGVEDEDCFTVGQEERATHSFPLGKIDQRERRPDQIGPDPSQPSVTTPETLDSSASTFSLTRRRESQERLLG